MFPYDFGPIVSTAVLQENNCEAGRETFQSTFRFFSLVDKEQFVEKHRFIAKGATSDTGE